MRESLITNHLNVKIQKMPSFLYTIIALSLVLWGILFRILTEMAPANIQNIIIVLAVFLLAISFTLSTPLFFYFKRKSKNVFKQRQVYRKSLKISAILGIGITTFMVLRAFNLLTVLNIALFYIPYVLILWQELKER